MAHEDLTREEHIEGSSDRSFGFVFTGFFALIALLPLLGGHEPRVWALVVSGCFGVVTLVRPAVLGPLNRLWMKFGLLLGRFVSPIALGILFFLVFTPMGLLMRLLGKDPMKLRFDRGAKSYWVEREPPGPPPTSMNNQF